MMEMTWEWLLPRWDTLFVEGGQYHIGDAVFTAHALRWDGKSSPAVFCWDFYDADDVKPYGVFFGGLPPAVLAYAEDTGVLTWCDLMFDEITPVTA